MYERKYNYAEFDLITKLRNQIFHLRIELDELWTLKCVTKWYLSKPQCFSYKIKPCIES